MKTLAMNKLKDNDSDNSFKTDYSGDETPFSKKVETKEEKKERER